MARRSPEKLKYRYGGGRVVGNLAYDFDYEERRRERYARPEPQERRESERRTETVRAPRRQEKTAARPRVRTRQRVSGVLVLEMTALAAMIVVVILSYARLTGISSEVVSMQKQLSTLQDEHVTLLTQYERTFDLTSIKEAAAAAGMYKPSASQINYIDLSAPDSVEVYDSADVNVLSRVFTSLGRGVGSVVEYFS